MLPTCLCCHSMPLWLSWSLENEDFCFSLWTKHPLKSAVLLFFAASIHWITENQMCEGVRFHPTYSIQAVINAHKYPSVLLNEVSIACLECVIRWGYQQLIFKNAKLVLMVWPSEWKLRVLTKLREQDIQLHTVKHSLYLGLVWGILWLIIINWI